MKAVSLDAHAPPNLIDKRENSSVSIHYMHTVSTEKTGNKESSECYSFYYTSTDDDAK